MSPTTTGAMASGSDAASIRTFAAAILHGDDEHRAWLTEAAEAHIAGTPMPPPRGKGTQAAALAAPAPVVPEGLRALSEAATQGNCVAPRYGDSEGGAYLSVDGIQVASGLTEEDADFLAAAVNHVRTLAATPSKPVGDGGEASAPPAGGGAVEGEPWTLARAFDLGFQWAAGLYASSQSREDSRAVGRTLLAPDFTSLNISLDDWDSFQSGDAGMCEGKRRIKAALNKIAAAPAAPEPAAGGEREGDDWRLVQIAPLTPTLMTPELGAAASQVNLAGCQLILAKQVQPLLSAPSEAETAGGETIETIAQWCENTFGPITLERIATRANEEMVELLAEPSKVEEAADVVIVLSRYPGLWEAIERKMKINRARRWRFMGDGTGYHVKDEPTPANAGAEGGQA